MARIDAIVGTTILVGVLAVSAQAQSQAPGNSNAEKTEQQAPLKIGGSVTAPRILSDPEPEYSEEARKAGYSGTCVISITVDTDGKVRDIELERPIGKGLDEKAIEAVRKWRFEPARKDGEAVAVRIRVEITFHLDGGGRETKIQKLQKRVDAGDAKAQLELAKMFFEGHKVSRNDTYANGLLLKAANQGLAAAQFLAAERAYPPHTGTADYVTAYMWYALAQRGGEKKSDKPLKKLTSKMTPEQLAEAQARVANWKPAPAK
jgi:TonB family protein